MFLLPLPFCGLALAAGMVFMPSKGRIGRLPPFDWFGFVFLGAALFLLMTAAASGPREGWLSDRILLYAVLGTVAAAAFVTIQVRSRAPLLDVSLFRHPAFTAAVIVAFVFGAGNFASGYVIPVFVQQVQSFTATKAGLLLMPAGLLLFFALPLTGRAADRLPEHVPILAGPWLLRVRDLPDGLGRRKHRLLGLRHIHDDKPGRHVLYHAGALGLGASRAAEREAGPGLRRDELHPPARRCVGHEPDRRLAAIADAPARGVARRPRRRRPTPPAGASSRPSPTGSASPACRTPPGSARRSTIWDRSSTHRRSPSASGTASSPSASCSCWRCCPRSIWRACPAGSSLRPRGRLLESVDRPDLKSVGRMPVRVRVPQRPPINSMGYGNLAQFVKTASSVISALYRHLSIEVEVFATTAANLSPNRESGRMRQRWRR